MNKYGTIKTSTGEVTTNDEILKLKKELNDIKIENEILKKAVAIFTKKQKKELILLNLIKISMMLKNYVKY